jgi:hypothetical protein
MLDAEALGRRIAQLDGYVDDVLDKAGRDHRVRLLAVVEGSRNVETLAKLSVLHAAEQQAAQQHAVAAEGNEPPVFDDDPDAVRQVLQVLIESGAAGGPVPPDDNELSQPAPEEGQQHG